MRIKTLSSGGIIPNYHCSAECRHCLYGCSLSWSNDYITKEKAREICRNLKLRGCRSVHIGGGEPFLNFNGLLDLVDEILYAGLLLEYIETNASWVTGNVRDKLSELKAHGVECLLISVDPFHIEYIPLEKPIALIKACNNCLDYFVWKQNFIAPLSKMSMIIKHGREELESTLGEDYIYDTAKKYGIGYNGRALNIAREFCETKPFDQIISSGPCMEIVGTNHYHVDYLGSYIPPGCTGMGVPLDELDNINEDKYPVFTKLYEKGIKGLYSYATENGFKENRSYTSKCELCFEIRKYLNKNKKTADITPDDFYKQNF